MSLIPAGSSLVREEESEETSETKLTEVTKDLGNTQMMEKGAEFHGTQSSKVLEETGSSTQNVECSAKVLQSASKTVSENRSVSTTKVQTSQSYSFEETSEYEETIE